MTNGPIAVIGASGQLARALTHSAVERGVRLAIAGRPFVDLTTKDSVARFLSSAAPCLVINAAAYTAVDKAESEPDAANLLNAEAPARLAQWCAENDVPLIHVSTDYVFDGRAQTPYREDDACNPQSVYGRSKLAGEQAVRAALERHVIVRTAWVYGRDGNNFLKTMLRLASERDVVRVVADQHGTPTRASDIASRILDIAARLALDGPAAPWGTYHLVSSGQTTWHGFAAEIFASAAALGVKTPQLDAITTREYPTPAVRPAYGVLDTKKLTDTFGIALPPWQHGVADCVRQLTR